MDNKKMLMRSVMMRHISGLSEYKKGSLIVLDVFGDRLEFNRKQILPISRIKHCEMGSETVTFDGHPISSALGFGLLAAYIAAWLSHLNYGETIGSIAFVSGCIGAIIGAISGLKPRKRHVTVLKINYHNIEGEASVIYLTEKSKSRKILARIADTINHAVGYTSRSTEAFIAKRYEI